MAEVLRELDEAVIREWVADLRENGHLQGKNCLYDGEKYCCLGRLAEIVYGPDCWSDEPVTGKNGLSPSVSGYVVNELASILDDELESKLLSLGIDQRTLGELNDEGISFYEIADIIEKDLDNS